MVPKLLIRERLEIMVVVPIVHVVEALGISSAHHGHPWGLEHLWLLNELVLPDVLLGSLGLWHKAVKRAASSRNGAAAAGTDSGWIQARL